MFLLRAVQSIVSGSSARVVDWLSAVCIGGDFFKLAVSIVASVDHILVQLTWKRCRCADKERVRSRLVCILQVFPFLGVRGWGT